MTAPNPPARLYAYLARNASVAVILRRGPTRHVRLITWNLKKDTFEHGQWFKGRIYERRCDLSPDGKLFVYFAATHKEPLRTWTAVSRPPYFTALALWPKGDCWHGGGWFISDSELELNHGEFEKDLHAEFKPEPLAINTEADGCSEPGDNSVWSPVRLRDGWIRSQKGTLADKQRAWHYDPPEVWSKKRPRSDDVVLNMAILSIGNRNRSWYEVGYRVTMPLGAPLEVGVCDWADWDRMIGDLLFARGGCIYRQHFANSQFLAPKLIANFNDETFNEVRPDASAKEWP